jgi:hypothetical protein
VAVATSVREEDRQYSREVARGGARRPDCGGR